MNYVKGFISALMLMSFISFGYAQEKEHEHGKRLAGKWTAECSTEFKDKATMQYCDLCPFIVNKDNKSKAMLKDFVMTFGKDSLTINQNETATTVPFRLDRESNMLSFSFNQKEYNFRILMWRHHPILENSDGTLIILTKDKAEKK